MVEYTTTQIVFISLGVVAVLVFFCFYLWIDYKRKRELPQKKPDILIRTIVASAALISILILAELIGIVEKGWNKKHIWIWGVIILSIAFIYWRYLKSQEPRPIEEIYLDVVVDRIQRFYNVKKYIGKAAFDAVRFWSRTARKTPWGDVQTIDQHYSIYHRENQGPISFLTEIDAMSEKMVLMQVDPSEAEISNLMRRLPVQSSMPVRSAFEGEEPKQQTVVTAK